MIAALRLVRHRPLLRRLLVAQAVSRCADAATMAMLAQLVVFTIGSGLTASSLAVSVAVSSLPAIAIAPLGGALVDRHRARRLLLAVHLTRAGLMLAALAVPAWSSRPLGYSIALALLVAGGVSVTTRAAALPRLVGPGELVTANAGTSLVSRAAGPVGLGVALVAGAAGGRGVFVIAAVMECVAAAVYAAAPAQLDGAQRPGRRSVRATPARPSCRHVRRCMRATLGHRALFGAAFAATALLVDRRYDLGASGHAAALGVGGTGALTGTLLAPHLARRLRRHHLLALSFALPAAAMWAAAVHPATTVVLVAMVGASFALQVVRLVTDATIQDRIGDHERGSVVSWFDAAHVLAFLCGVLAVVALAHDRPDLVFAPVAIAYVTGAGAHALRRRSPALLEALG